ncbi:MAG: DUF87 domain-containing protein [Sphaerospermopsis sp. SIO1G2]|nr:DUF87 domain-containing protein [Sphaerospermopsis sp. SIO1G2]
MIMSTLTTISRYVPESIKKALPTLLGLVCMACALFTLLALVTYDSGDPSLNRASSAEVANLMGASGAVIADIALQLFGLGAVMIPIISAAWGWRLLADGHITHVSFRICALLVSLVLLSTLLYYAPSSPASWLNGELGGSIGTVVGAPLAEILPTLFIVVVAFFIWVAVTLFASGVKRHEWQHAYYHIIRMGAAVMWLCRSAASMLKNDIGHLSDDQQSSTQTPRKAKIRKIDPTKTFASQAKKKTVSVKQRTAKEKQASFELRSRGGDYELPSLELLATIPKSKHYAINEEALKQNATMLESVLHDFGVKGEIINIRPGPVVTLYELEPSPGTKSSRVIGLADDIARSMSAVSARISVIPGRNALGIELPNTNRQTVYLRENLEDSTFRETKAKLPMVLGKNIGGEPMVVDLAKMPHLLVAGTTGSGKSVAVNTMITSLLYHHSPDTCKFIMIDPKMLELSVYNDIPHLLSPVVTEPGKAVVALKWTVKEMENRYRLMASLGVRNVDNYNKRIREAKRTGEVLTREVQTGFDPDTGRPTYESQTLDMQALPFIVVVVDEMADLMLVAGKEIEGSIQRLAQMARAAGIHIIMATQRPSVDVITGVIKANFPTRISFQVTSKIDSRTILGEQGAEQLLGQGDMLYMAGGGRITRVHGPFVSDAEVEDIVSHLKRQAPPSYVEDVTKEDDEVLGAADDEEESEEDRLLYDRAVQIVARDRKASTSYIQRCLKIGYNRAARIIERMERDGAVSAANHVGKREVLLPEPVE